jgi:hypothetical protein
MLIWCYIDATKFKEAFEAAKVFNAKVKSGETEGLVYAEVVEDIEEKVEDDVEKNVTADAEGGDQD